MQKKKKTETSKQILFVLFICSIIFVIFNMYLSCKTGDTSVMQAISEGLFRLLGVAVGFYYWKARSENIRKYNKRIKKEMPENAEGGSEYGQF